MEKDEAARVAATATAAAAAASAQAANPAPAPKATRPVKQPAIKPRGDVGRNVPTTRKHSV